MSAPKAGNGRRRSSIPDPPRPLTLFQLRLQKASQKLFTRIQNLCDDPPFEIEVMDPKVGSGVGDNETIRRCTSESVGVVGNHAHLEVKGVRSCSHVDCAASFDISEKSPFVGVLRHAVNMNSFDIHHHMYSLAILLEHIHGHIFDVEIIAVRVLNPQPQIGARNLLFREVDTR